MKTTEGSAASRDDDMDQRDGEDRDLGQGATSGAVIEGASADLDARIGEHEKAVAAMKAAAQDLIDGIDEELDALADRTAKLRAQRDRLSKGAGKLQVFERSHPVDTLSGVQPGPTPDTGERAARAATDGLRRAGRRRGRKARAKARTGQTHGERILAFLREHPKSSNLQVAEVLGFTQQIAASKVNALKRAGKLRKHGKGKKITWSAV